MTRKPNSILKSLNTPSKTTIPIPPTLTLQGLIDAERTTINYARISQILDFQVMLDNVNKLDLKLYQKISQKLYQ